MRFDAISRIPRKTSDFSTFADFSESRGKPILLIISCVRYNDEMKYLNKKLKRRRVTSGYMANSAILSRSVIRNPSTRLMKLTAESRL